MKYFLLVVLSGIAWAQPPVQRMVTVANASSTGTTIHKLAKLTGAPSKAVVSGAGDTGGAIGIVNSGAGTTGSATIQEVGQTTCVFDGATTAGHYVQISASVAGDCTDAGASFPTSGGQVIGVVLSTNGSGGTYTVDLSLRQASLGGGASPAGSAGACNAYLDSTHFQGDVANCFEQIGALATPAAPTVTHPVGSAMETYGYEIAWIGPVGFGIFSAETQTMTGPTTLSATNKNIITPTSCPTGATGYAVFRTTGPITTGRLTPDGTCGVAYNDTSDAQADGQIWNGTFDTTAGVAIAPNFRMPSQGDVPWQFYVGSAQNSFSPALLNIDLCCADYVFAYHGDTNNAYNGLISIAESTSGGTNAMGAYSYATTDGAQPVSLWAEGGNTGGGLVDRWSGVVASVDVLGSGRLTTARAFTISGNPGNSVDNYVHFNSFDTTAAVSNISFNSGMNAGTGKFAFYGAGTAVSGFNGPMQFLGDVINPFIQTKNTQSATAPGAAKCDVRVIAGTNAGTGKIVINCGTSATEVTIADNVGTAF